MGDVAVDGSVFIADFPTALRWIPDGRSFASAPDSHFKDVNGRGDVLLGGGNYGGDLQVWPVGGSRGREVDSPRGHQTATVLTK